MEQTIDEIKCFALTAHSGQQWLRLGKSSKHR